MNFSNPTSSSHQTRYSDIVYRLTQILLGLLACWMLSIQPTFAEVDDSVVNLQPVNFNHTQIQILHDIIGQLERQHYQPKMLNDQLALEITTTLLNNLDPYHSLLSQQDLAYFAVLKTELDDVFRSEQWELMNDLFNLIHQRRLAFASYSLSLVEPVLYDFNFGLDEHLHTDRSKQPWLQNLEALRDLWRRQVKHEVLMGRLEEEPDQIIQDRLTKRYQNLHKRLLQYSNKDAFQQLVNAYTSVIDPHTQYYPPHQLENFNIDMSLSLEGIGAVLQRDNDYTKVVRLIPAGPADKAGELKVSDRIVGVAQGQHGEIVDVVGWRLDDVVKLVRGPKGSLVRLQIIASNSQDKSRTEIQIVRNKVNLEEQSAKSSLINIKQNDINYRIGVITIPTFYHDFAAQQAGDPNYKSTSRDVKSILEQLQTQQVEGIIIDLRNNGGGSLSEANKLIGLFITTGGTVQIRGASGRLNLLGDPNAEINYTGPLVVLVNRLSASASEIFAGAMQDYQRGIVIGSQTFGKGTVQSMIPMRYGKLKLTQAKFYRISGASTQHQGVIPDIALPAWEDPQKIGESALTTALQWDEITPISYTPVSYTAMLNLQQAVPYLQQSQQERSLQDPDFNYTRKIVAKNRALETAVSLNQKTRQAYKLAEDSWYLQTLNELRQSKDMEPVNTLNGHTMPDYEPDNDPYLKASGHVLIDMVNLM